ncbi:MAG: 50S ribosomal protein L35 [Thermomicrobiales bacterium]
MTKGPKLKTHKGAKKRFSFTANGAPMMAKGMKSHFRRRKAKRVLRALDRMHPVDESMVKNIKRLLPYGN